MFKPLELRTLMDLVQDFEGAYRGYWHTLRKVRIGQYVSHDPHSVEQIEWKHSILDVEKLTKEELRKELERHTRDMRLKVQHHQCSDKKKKCFCVFLHIQPLTSLLSASAEHSAEETPRAFLPI